MLWRCVLAAVCVVINSGLVLSQTGSVAERARQERERQNALRERAPEAQGKGDATKQRVVTTQERVVTTQEKDLGGLKLKVHIDAEATTTSDCGSKDCFQQKFAACQPATSEVSMAGFASFQYKIIGPATGGCRMIMKYTSNPNPDWVNKEMTCTFDNKIPLPKAIENAFSDLSRSTLACEGPLHKLMQ